MTPARLYVRVAIVGCWSLIVGLIGVIVAGGVLSSLPGETGGSPDARLAGLAVLPLLSSLFAGLFDAGLSGMGAGAVLMLGGVYLCRPSGRSGPDRRGSTRL